MEPKDYTVGDANEFTMADAIARYGVNNYEEAFDQALAAGFQTLRDLFKDPNMDTVRMQALAHCLTELYRVKHFTAEVLAELNDD